MHNRSPTTPLLEIRDLDICFDTEEGRVHAVCGVSLKVGAGRTLGLVGESGCGKSVTCHAVLRLLASNGRIAGGQVLFEGKDLLSLSEAECDAIRGRSIAMIFQDPSSSLNPVHTIGRQIAESLMLHRGLHKRKARGEALALLERVGVPDARRRLDDYPHQLSGGMNQRVMIAMALACRPKLLIADEPTTALDVTIQAQILDLLKDLQAETGMALILITHDLAVVAETADDVAVMYAGRIVEEAPVDELFRAPTHPYTVGLLESLPRVDQTIESLNPIEGIVPSPFAMPPGCAFEPRCRFASAACSASIPALRPIRDRQSAACIHPRSVS